MEPPVVAEARGVVEGLLYPSESDEAFEVFWVGSGELSGVEAVGVCFGELKPVEAVDVGGFFRALETSQDAGRFLRLREFLRTRLTEVQVLRSQRGEGEVDVYILGKLTELGWIVLKTMSVET